MKQWVNGLLIKDLNLKLFKNKIKIAINVLIALILIELTLKLIGVKISFLIIALTFGVFIVLNLLQTILKNSKDWFDYLTILFILIIIFQFINLKEKLVSKGIINPILISFSMIWFLSYYFKKISFKEENNKLRNFLFMGAALIIIVGSFLKVSSLQFGSQIFWSGIILGIISIVIEFYHWVKK